MSHFPRAPWPMRDKAAALAAAAAFAALSGCAGTPPENFYTLSPVAVTAAAVPGPFANAAIVVEPAALPDLVDRPQFVLRTGNSKVAILEQQRWAEPLKVQIARTVAANLARLLGGARVSANPPAGAPIADYRVTLEVQQFESGPGDAVRMEVVWTVRGSTPASSRSGRATVRETVSGEGFEALVAAYNRALGRISDAIAAALGN